MLKKVFVAAAIIIACPAVVFAQDIFFRFGGSLPEAGGVPPTRTFVTDPDTTSGSVFIYSRSGFNFREGSFRFFISNPDVVAITGGEVFDPTFNVVGGRRFSETEIILESNSGVLNLSGISLSFGISQALGELFDPLYDPSLGPDGAFLLARIDYDVVGIGSSLFALSPNDGGVTDFLPDGEAVSLLPEFQNVAFSNIDPNVDPDEPFIPPTDISFLFGGSLPEAGGEPVTSTFFSPFGTVGSVNVYSRSGFDFDAADIDFFSSDPSVVLFTDVEIFNPTFDIVGGTRFDSPSAFTTADGDSGNLFMIAILENGINQELGEVFDPLFDPSVGPEGSFLIARVDYAVVGIGVSEFSLSLGGQGILELPGNELFPLFGNATFSSIPLPVLGDINQDGVVSFLDIAPLIEILSTNGFSFEADANQDGVVNFLDIAPFIELLTAT